MSKLAAKDPANAGWQHDLSVGHNSVGGVLEQQNDSAGALKEFTAALAIMAPLAGEASEQPRVAARACNEP